MALAFLLDENLPRRVLRTIQRHNERGADPLDVLVVGGPGDLPLSSDDATILLWAERERRILLTEDKHTMPRHLASHLQAGHHSPGVFLIRPGTSSAALLEFVVLAAHASDPQEWGDRIEFVP